MALSKIRNDSLADTAVHGRRRININGDMKVWQRGTSKTGLSSGNNYLVDRWNWKVTSFGVWRIDQSTDTPNDSFKHSFKAECTTAASSIGSTDQLRFIHSIEGQDLVHLAYGSSAAKKTTLSFWIKCSKAATYAISLEAGSGRNYIVHYTVDAADTWEYKTITIDGDTSTALANQSNGAGITYSWWFGVGTNYDADETQNAWYTDADYSGLTGGVTTDLSDTVGNAVYITGVQLEVGDTATPFEHRSYGEELALCQRYYQTIGEQDGDDLTISPMTNHAHRIGVPYLPVEMRATPTITYYHWDTGTTGQLREFSSGTARTVSADHGQGKRAGGYMQFTANLSNPVNFTAKFDAEL